MTDRVVLNDPTSVPPSRPGISGDRSWSLITVGATAFVGAATAFALLAVLLYRSTFGWAESGVLTDWLALLSILAIGAIAGAVIALPGSMPSRLVHPCFGFCLIVLFGPVDWTPEVHLIAKLALQISAFALLIAFTRKIRHWGWRPAVTAFAVALTLSVLAVVPTTLREVLIAQRGYYTFGENGLADRIGTLATQRSKRGPLLPDLWLIVTDRYPSPREARRRGYGYPADALDRLRGRGWRIRDDATTQIPNTQLTVAATLALTTMVRRGDQVETDPLAIKVLHDQRRLIARPSFTHPLLLRTLRTVGYETHGWIGWWVKTDRIPFDHVHRARRRWLPLYAQSTFETWLQSHASWTNPPDRFGHTARSAWDHCLDTVRQRESFFSDVVGDGDRAPRFVFYHVLWLHDVAKLGIGGECLDELSPEPVTGLDPYVAFDVVACRDTPFSREALNPDCARELAQVRRNAAMVSYLPVFLDRLEHHVRGVAGQRAFRILVFSDEGLNDTDVGFGADPTPWRDHYWRKHPAVFRATFDQRRDRLWSEAEIPDLPQAVRLTVEALLRE